MEGLNWKELEQIPIPEGLEERLSAKIDEWEKDTLSPTLPRIFSLLTSKSPPLQHLLPLSLEWGITSSTITRKKSTLPSRTPTKTLWLPNRKLRRR